MVSYLLRVLVAGAALSLAANEAPAGCCPCGGAVYSGPSPCLVRIGPFVEVQVPPSNGRVVNVQRAVLANRLIKKNFNRHIAAQPKTVTRLGPAISELDPTLLEPTSAPDCAFRDTMSNPSTVEQTRMKLDYEAQCYRQSEEIVRARLQRLQDAVEKMIRTARQSSR